VTPRLLGALILVALPLRAAAYDPQTDWQTLETPHLRVHYARGMYDQALEVARAGEHAWGELTRRLGWAPEPPVDIIYADEQDFAQGYAQSVPYNLIGLNATAPEDVSDLGAFDDWTYHLVAHELAHVVHIDTILGMPRILNSVLGRTLAPNGVQPRWFVEGLAVYFETALTSQGRARSAYSEMVLRMAVLGGAAPSLDQLSGISWHWPQGSVPYLFGGRFLDYLVRRFGEEALRDVSYDYGGRLFPWALNLSLERATGVTYPVLWSDFLWSLRRRFDETLADVEVRGRIEGRRLTESGQSLGAPRIAADGTVYYAVTPIGEHAQLVARRPDGTESTLAWVQSGSQLALEPDGRHAIVAQLDAVGPYLVLNDLHRVALDDGDSERLSDGLRARDPDVSPDGRSVVFARDHGVVSAVALAPLDDVDGARNLFEPGGHVWGPRFSPDGSRVVVAASTLGGARDIFSIDIATGAATRLTDDRALDGGPVFSLDGRFVLFHSDRDGIYNLYAVPAGGGPVRRLTRVLGGAFHPEPAPDGRVLYRTYGPTGFDLAELDRVDLEALPAAEAPRSSDGAPVERATVDVYPSDAYSPLATLWPRAWTPLTTVDTRGATVGAAIAGNDALGRHAYLLSAWWGITSQFLGFVASYANRTFHPGVQVELGRSLGFANVPYRRNGRAFPVEEEVWAGRLGTTWPLYLRRDWFVGLGTSWEITNRTPRQELVFAPDDRAPQFPDEGRFAAARVSLVLTNAQSYLGSISPEHGGRTTLSVRVEDPYLGSDYSAVSGTLDHVQYVENPWLERHVLALKLGGGLGDSNYRRRRLFGIGGLQTRDVVLDLLGGLLGSAGGLRGFPAVPFVGDALVNGSIEYRVPLFDVESGYETLPIYVRALHAAAFVDGAAIADRPEDLAGLQHYSAGVELRLSFVLGDALPSGVRLGFGQGLGDDADVRGGYLVLGQAF
jgi:hypothetical protein